MESTGSAVRPALLEAPLGDCHSALGGCHGFPFGHARSDLKTSARPEQDNIPFLATPATEQRPIPVSPEIPWRMLLHTLFLQVTRKLED